MTEDLNDLGVIIDGEEIVPVPSVTKEKKQPCIATAFVTNDDVDYLICSYLEVIPHPPVLSIPYHQKGTYVYKVHKKQNVSSHVELVSQSTTAALFK